MLAVAGMAGEPQLFARLEGLSHIAIGVSGGSDSTALMCLVSDWEQSQAAAPRISILTVDHGLREGSAAEAATVAGWAMALGFHHHILTWQGPKPATGLQAQARQARYDLMTSWCNASGAQLLLTGHTMDDQAETVAMRMQRTMTDASLAGVWRSRDWQGIAVHRPLLGLRREALRGYLRARSQGWIDDPSNEQERFERVRVRRALQVDGGTQVAVLAARAAAAAHRTEELQSAARAFEALHVQWSPLGFATVDRLALGELRQDVQEQVIASLIGELTGAAAAPGKLASLAGWVGNGGASRRSLGGVLFALRKTSLLVGREPGRIPAGASEIPASGRLLWDNRFWVEAAPGTFARLARLGSASLAPDMPMPRFVADGWPEVVDREGLPAPALAAFKPCLR